MTVQRNGWCILEAFCISYRALGGEINLHIAKGELEKELLNNLEFYNNFIKRDIEIAFEIAEFLKNPSKNYIMDTVDLFVQALCKSFSVNATVYQINTQGEISELDVTVDERFEKRCMFAKTSIRHMDAVLEVPKV